MEFYGNDTPATMYFLDQELILRGSRVYNHETFTSESTQACLYMRFNFVGGVVRLSVYDDVAKIYTHQFESQSVEGLEKFLSSVEADYNVTLPEKFLSSPTEFFSLAKESFYIEVDLDEDPNDKYFYCDQCGDTNGNYFIGFYFPAINPDIPATLATGWDYGCFGGEKIAGDLDIVETAAFELLDRAIISADPMPSHEIQEFRRKIEKLNLVG